MNLFKQTTLIGIGLIGSSIARVLKKKRLSKKIFIFSKTQKTINKAKKLKLGNFYTNNLEKSVEGSDLIIICTPLSTYKNILDKISNHIMPNTILTDVGSAKLNAVKIFNKNLELEPLFGIEQEFFITRCGSPFGFPRDILYFPEPQGNYYCGTGADYANGRKFIEDAIANEWEFDNDGNMV